MRDAGLAQVKAAQADGRWDAAYEPQSRATIPDDLQQALDQNPVAQEFFATLTGTRRYAFLYRLHNVRTPAKRAERIAELHRPAQRAQDAQLTRPTATRRMRQIRDRAAGFVAGRSLAPGCDRSKRSRRFVADSTPRGFSTDTARRTRAHERRYARSLARMSAS